LKCVIRRDESPVQDVAERREARRRAATALFGRDEKGVARARRTAREECRKQAARGRENARKSTSVPLVLTEEEERDEEAAEHEEDVDAEKTAACRRYVTVPEQYRDDRCCAQAVESRPVGTAARHLQEG
jgi:hypothetical protein